MSGKREASTGKKTLQLDQVDAALQLATKMLSKVEKEPVATESVVQRAVRNLREIIWIKKVGTARTS